MTSQNKRPQYGQSKPLSTQAVENCVHLAIETTGQTGSLALLKGKDVLKNITLGGEMRTAAALAPALGNVLDDANLPIAQLGFVTVAEGPGSFTGLRIGVTTAKTLCYASSISMVAVDSLAAIAATIFHDHTSAQRVLVGLNAYRGQVFTALFDRSSLFDQSSFPATADTEVLSQEQWASKLSTSHDSQTFYAGDEKVFARTLDEDAIANRFLQRKSADAVGVGLLGFESAMRADFRDPLGLTPKYLKLSAAEEKLL